MSMTTHSATRTLWGELRSALAHSDASIAASGALIDDIFRRWPTTAPDYDAAVSFLRKARPDWQPQRVAPPPPRLLVRWLDGAWSSLLRALSRPRTLAPYLPERGYERSEHFLRVYKEEYAGLVVGHFTPRMTRRLFEHLQTVSAPLSDESGWSYGAPLPLEHWFPRIEFFVDSWDSLFFFDGVALLPSSTKRWSVLLDMMDFEDFGIDIGLHDETDAFELLDLFESLYQLQRTIPALAIGLQDPSLDEVALKEEGCHEHDAMRLRMLWHSYCLLRSSEATVFTE